MGRRVAQTCTHDRQRRPHRESPDLARFLAGPPSSHAQSFPIYRERGIIDILAWHAGKKMLLVIELKTDIADVNELVGTVDRKRRLAIQVARDRGWPVDMWARVSVWVIVADSPTNRRRVQAHGSMLRAAFPADGRAIGGWLRDPRQPIRALSFWRDAQDHRQPARSMPVRRVSRAA